MIASSAIVQASARISNHSNFPHLITDMTVPVAEMRKTLKKVFNGSKSSRVESHAAFSKRITF
jgi:hypothetical protein